MGLDMFLTRDGEEIGYWRKVNAIHRWFVENVQDGVDDCSVSDVSIEQLQTLLYLCKKVVKNPLKHSKLLEPGHGFFFGSYDIDTNYIYGLRQTIDILEKCLKHPESKFQYEASW